jgi:hypothetical protein
LTIRKDIETQKNLQTLVYQTQEAFPIIFPTIEEVTKYINSLKPAKIAELLLVIGEYYHSAKFYSCDCLPPKRTETCPNCNGKFKMPDLIVLSMVLSVIEKLASVTSNGAKSWVDFYDWVNGKEINKEYTQALRNGKYRDSKAFIDSLKARWDAEFASLTKITNFLKAIMSPDEKIKFIKSIRYVQKVPQLPSIKKPHMEANISFEDAQKNNGSSFEDNQKITFKRQEDVKQYFKQSGSKTASEALPICFDYDSFWKCYALDNFGHGEGFCRSTNYCRLLTDQSKVDKYFKETVRTTYDWRRQFIHDAQLPPIREAVSLGVIFKGKHCAVELSTTDFKMIFERLVKKFFDKFQTTV